MQHTTLIIATLTVKGEANKKLSCGSQKINFKREKKFIEFKILKSTK